MSRDICFFRQHVLKTRILSRFENLLHHIQKSRYLQPKIKPFKVILQVFTRILAQCQPELKPETETESTDKKETSLQKEAKKHQERKTREDLSKRKAQLLAELAEIEGEI